MKSTFIYFRGMNVAPVCSYTVFMYNVDFQICL